MEGFGIVAAEASLSGLIVVASNIDGIPDAIIHGKNGIFVDSEDEEGYCEVLRQIMEHLGEYKELAKHYSKYTKENYSWDSICAVYRDEMKKLKGK